MRILLEINILLNSKKILEQDKHLGKKNRHVFSHPKKKHKIILKRTVFDFLSVYMITLIYSLTLPYGLSLDVQKTPIYISIDH